MVVSDQLGYLASTGKSDTPIYGDPKCTEWAWSNYGGIGANIRWQTIRNADSYAWMVSYNYFAYLWSWTDSGKPTKRELSDGVDKRQDEGGDGTPVETEPSDQDEINLESLGEVPLAMPTPPDGWCVEGEDGCAFPGYDLSDTGGCWLS